MENTNSNIIKLRIKEDYNYNYKLDFLSKFNKIYSKSSPKISKISLNFGFKNINFDKKKMISFFMILELISNQKSYITFSKKNLMAIKIKKGSITGCKVTLRNKNLYNFIDTLILALPRAENFKGFILNKKNKNMPNVFINMSNIFIFYAVESELAYYVKNLNINFIINSFSDDEKIFLLTYFKMPFINK